jgi:hypothetical protein
MNMGGWQRNFLDAQDQAVLNASLWLMPYLVGQLSARWLPFLLASGWQL